MPHRHRGLSLPLMIQPQKPERACPPFYCFISILLQCIRRPLCLAGRFWCGWPWKIIFKKKRLGQTQMHVDKHGEDKEIRLCPRDRRELRFPEINAHVWNHIRGISRKHKRFLTKTDFNPFEWGLDHCGRMLVQQKQTCSHKNKRQME